jgi:hypothetical protein
MSHVPFGDRLEGFVFFSGNLLEKTAFGFFKDPDRVSLDRV